MISLNNEPCCVCGDTRSQLVQEASYPEHGYPGSFCLRRCAGCGLLFNSPRLDDRDLGKLYGQNYYFFQRPDERELGRIVPMIARTVALVRDQVPADQKIFLDVGSGRGYFPAVLKELGWDAHGVEISSGAAEYSRQRFGLQNIFTGTIEQYIASPQMRTFPLVTAIDVIEHVPNPAAFVAALGKVVQTNGRVIIDTPNATAHNIRVQGIAWKGFNPFHIFLFNVANLSKLLEEHGFSVEQSFSYHNAAMDETPPPLGAQARDALIAGARSIGVLGPLAKIYLALRAKWDGRKKAEIKEILPPIVERARTVVAYPHTTDAQDRLARSATGDNIVVIAKKI